MKEASFWRQRPPFWQEDERLHQSTGVWVAKRQVRGFLGFISLNTNVCSYETMGGKPVSVCVYLAAVTSVTLRAGATEGLQGILTDASVEAGLGVTLIDLVLAMGASEA